MRNATSYGLADAVARRIAACWAGEARASVAVAEDPAHALELLAAGRPGGCSAVVFYLSDDAAGDDDIRVTALLRVAVVQTPGLRLRGGTAAPTVLQLVDSLRRWMARQRWEETLGGEIEYRGMTHIPAKAGEALHGYALTFAAEYAYEV